MGIFPFGKTAFDSHYPKINGIQWDYFNGNQWENLPRDDSNFFIYFFIHYRILFVIVCRANF